MTVTLPGWAVLLAIIVVWGAVTAAALTWALRRVDEWHARRVSRLIAGCAPGGNPEEGDG